MVLAMHAGFAFLEVGTVRRKNQVNALVKIFTDFCVSTLVYFFVGYAIAYGVDFFSGAIYYLLDIPDDLFISIFAMGRIPGWTVQVMEQFKNNILLRPRLQYVGPMDVEYIPIEQR